MIMFGMVSPLIKWIKNMIKVACVLLMCATVLFSFSLWLVDRKEARQQKAIEFLIEHKLWQPPLKNTGTPLAPEKI
jgi:uncharacterized membrane protein YsdA (DUF1294 family)